MTRHALIISFGVSLFVSAGAASIAAAAPTTITLPGGWTLGNPGSGDVGVETVAKQTVLRGVAADRVEQPNVALEPGKKYVASVRVRGVRTTPASSAMLYVTSSSGGKKKKSVAARYDARGDEWQTLRIEVDAPDEAPQLTFELSWTIAEADKQGTFLFADASVAVAGGKNLLANPSFKKTAGKEKSTSWFKLALPAAAKAPKGGNYIQNGGFETTFAAARGVLGTKLWDYYALYVVKGALALASGDCHGGSSCIAMNVIRCKNAKQCGREEGPLLAQTIQLRPGKIYKLAAWTKASDKIDRTLAAPYDTHPGVVRLYLPSSGKTVEIRVPREANAWQELSAEIAATPRDYEALLEVDGYLRVDDISLREIPALSQPEPAEPPAGTQSSAEPATPSPPSGSSARSAAGSAAPAPTP